MFFNPLRVVGKTGFIVVVSFLILVTALALVIRASSRPPVVESISPQAALPGDILVITGRDFGSDRGQNRVRISGRVPTASAYLEWSDRVIRLRLPADTTSGLVYVYTGNGRSNGVLFTNSDHLPERVAAVQQPGRPVITSIAPTVSQVGDIITIHGRRFGENRKNSRVLFFWSSRESDNPGHGASRQGTVEGTVADFAYELWSERLIRVRVPDGAMTGPVVVQTDKGTSPPVVLQVEKPAGEKVFGDRRQFAIHYAVEIDQVRTDPQLGNWNRLYVWKPRVQSLPEQRDIQIISRSGEPLFEDVFGLTIYEFSNVSPGGSYRISATVMFDRYEVLTRIDPNRVPVRYTIDERFTRKYLSETSILPVTDPAIVNTARTVAGRIQNPYLKAQALYNWVLDRLEPVAREASPRPVEAIETRSGNAYTYATLYAALLRAAGVPARVIAGHLIDVNGQVIRHYWTEFFLQSFGWVPSDPSLGDGHHLERLPERDGRRAFYFGNLDAGRLTFSAGLLQVRNLHVDGVRRSIPEMYSLQSHYEEMVGNIIDYRSRWFDVILIGE